MALFALDDSNEELFPHPSMAEPDGLLAIGGNLSVKRLTCAYAKGIFPWYGKGQPILWWSPDPRCVLFPAEYHMPKSLRKCVDKQVFSCTADTAFSSVIEGCSRQRQEGTWLLDEMKEAYTRLHLMGIAHSFEVWQESVLAGGLYGVSLGRAFFGESMFYRQPNASKVALYALVQFALRHGWLFIDCQQETDNLTRFGARNIERAEFLDLLRTALRFPTLQQRWTGL